MGPPLRTRCPSACAPASSSTRSWLSSKRRRSMDEKLAVRAASSPIAFIAISSSIASTAPSRLKTSGLLIIPCSRAYTSCMNFENASTLRSRASASTYSSRWRSPSRRRSSAPGLQRSSSRRESVSAPSRTPRPAWAEAAAAIIAAGGGGGALGLPGLLGCSDHALGCPARTPGATLQRRMAFMQL
ncbi:MAG: hypothetical protein J3K34DRAFT_400162 [Monoraphidium minutum]|nr:MAG: hypothetical protein J3K34DRAFT_400162 [Monoraphidium minutum]